MFSFDFLLRPRLRKLFFVSLAFCLPASWPPLRSLRRPTLMPVPAAWK